MKQLAIRKIKEWALAHGFYGATKNFSKELPFGIIKICINDGFPGRVPLLEFKLFVHNCNGEYFIIRKSHPLIGADWFIEGAIRQMFTEYLDKVVFSL